MEDVTESSTCVETTLPVAGGPSRGEQSHAPKWLRWRKNGAAVIEYLLDSQVHTYAFSVAANAIISFIPFIVLLYTISREFFHSEAMVEVIGKMVHLLPALEPRLGGGQPRRLHRRGMGFRFCRW